MRIYAAADNLFDEAYDRRLQDACALRLLAQGDDALATIALIRALGGGIAAQAQAAGP